MEKCFLIEQDEVATIFDDFLSRKKDTTLNSKQPKLGDLSFL